MVNGEGALKLEWEGNVVKVVGPKEFVDQINWLIIREAIQSYFDNSNKEIQKIIESNIENQYLRWKMQKFAEQN